MFDQAFVVAPLATDDRRRDGRTPSPELPQPFRIQIVHLVQIIHFGNPGGLPLEEGIVIVLRFALALAPEFREDGLHLKQVKAVVYPLPDSIGALGPLPGRLHEHLLGVEEHPDGQVDGRETVEHVDDHGDRDRERPIDESDQTADDAVPPEGPDDVRDHHAENVDPREVLQIRKGSDDYSTEAPLLSPSCHVGEYDGRDEIDDVDAYEEWMFRQEIVNQTILELLVQAETSGGRLPRQNLVSLEQVEYGDADVIRGGYEQHEHGHSNFLPEVYPRDRAFDARAQRMLEHVHFATFLERPNIPYLAVEDGTDE